MMNRRTFARLHSVRMLATPTDMSVPGERVLFWSDAANDGLHAVKSTCQAPCGKDIFSDKGQSVGRGRQSLRMASNGYNAVFLCKCMLYHSPSRRTPSLQQPLSSCLPPLGTHRDDSDCERHPSLVVRQVSGRRLDASGCVEKMQRQFAAR